MEMGEAIQALNEGIDLLGLLWLKETSESENLQESGRLDLLERAEKNALLEQDFRTLAFGDLIGFFSGLESRPEREGSGPCPEPAIPHFEEPAAQLLAEWLVRTQDHEDLVKGDNLSARYHNSVRWNELTEQLQTDDARYRAVWAFCREVVRTLKSRVAS